MPYNISEHVIVRMKRYLDDMLSTQRSINWPTREPEKLARRVREALFAVRYHPQYERYHDLHNFFKICVHDRYVEAKWKGPLTGRTMQEALSPEGKKIDGVMDLQSIIGAAIKFAITNDELHFPDAHLDEKDLKTLYQWGKKNEWKLVYQFELGVTLTRRNVDKILLWEPED